MKNFINDDVIIDFKIPNSLDWLISQCEKYNEEDNYGAYENYADFLVNVACKELYAHGKMTQKQWDKMGMKYQL